MSRIWTWLFIFAACLNLSCSGSNERNERVKDWMKPNGRIKTLSTIAMINDVVSRVGGEHIDPLVLITGELDPHSYQLVKGDDEKLAIADVIFYNGLNLEHGPSLKKSLHDNSKAIALGDRVRQVEPELILEYNGQTDPHIWMDMQLWMRTIPYVVEALSKRDPEHAEEYKANGEQLAKELAEVDAQIRGELQSIPEEKRYLVTSHDAFNYFTRSYLATDEEVKNGEWQKRFAAPEGLSPDSQLSAHDIRAIVSHLAEYRIQVLFPESNLSRDSIRKIVDAAREKGLDVYIADCPLYGDAMGAPGSDGDTYAKMIEHNAKLVGLYLRDYNPHIKPNCD